MAVADALEAKGDVCGALAMYDESLALRRRLSAADPANGGFQCDLAVNLMRAGEALESYGDRVRALASYREAVEIADRVSQGPSGSSQWQSDLAILKERVEKLARETSAPRA
jgi:hypothetical protein